VEPKDAFDSPTHTAQDTLKLLHAGIGVPLEAIGWADYRHTRCPECHARVMVTPGSMPHKEVMFIFTKSAAMPHLCGKEADRVAVPAHRFPGTDYSDLRDKEGNILQRSLAYWKGKLL
jgi:hypothetical protein